jgi:predicted small integral membrane protein
MAEKKEGREKGSIVKGNSFGASGFTLGILSIVSLGVFGVVLSIMGFVFCLVQQKKKPTKLGKAGLIVNAIGFILSLLWIFYFAPMLNEWMEQLGTLS